MKKQVKIILVSGISITINEDDELIMCYESGVVDNNNIEEVVDVKFEDIKIIAPSIMSKEGNIWLKHKLSTGEYMEYYLTRDKITWCYYSEVKEEEDDDITNSD